MPVDIPIKLKDERDSLDGHSPVVLIGPNGSGKTRHATEMTQWNNAELIGALREIALPENLAMQTLEQSSNELQQHFRRRRGQYWQVSSEINTLFSKLLAEDGAALYEWRDQWDPNNPTGPPYTTIRILSEFWREIYPGRSISFAGSNPVISNGNNSDDGNIEEYPVLHGSDGERVAVYLAARVLNAAPGVLIIDEPEVHFHTRLAVRFWNRLETIRPDCRFVYVTHDLQFALSRKDATFAVVLPGSPPQIVDLHKDIPDQLAQTLLSAASFSIHAKRIIFCEGTESSLDFGLYSAWFNSRDTALIPVESCEQVVQCTTSFRNSSIVTGVHAIGIIDRDYWPDRYLDSLPDGLSALPVHEVESIFCLRSVFEPIARYLNESDPSASFEKFLDRAKSLFPNGQLNKEISHRFRRAGEHELRLAMNNLEISEDIGRMEANHCTGLNPGNWTVPPTQLFAREKVLIEQALAGGEEEFLRYLPGKGLIEKAARVLGTTEERYLALVYGSLNCSDDSEAIWQTGIDIAQGLEPYLPPRVLLEASRTDEVLENSEE